MTLDWFLHLIFKWRETSRFTTGYNVLCDQAYLKSSKSVLENNIYTYSSLRVKRESASLWFSSGRVCSLAYLTTMIVINTASRRLSMVQGEQCMLLSSWMFGLILLLLLLLLRFLLRLLVLLVLFLLASSSYSPVVLFLFFSFLSVLPVLQLYCSCCCSSRSSCSSCQSFLFSSCFFPSSLVVLSLFYSSSCSSISIFRHVHVLKAWSLIVFRWHVWQHITHYKD